MSICSWVAKTTRFLWIHPWNGLESEEQSSNTSVGDVEFEFFDVGEVIKSGQNASGLKQCHSLEKDSNDDEENDRSGINEKNQSFWETQHLDLQVIGQLLNYIWSCFFKCILHSSMILF